MASFGESWNCLLEAAARSRWRWLRGGPWFCYQLFAVLLRSGRRCTGLADLAALPHCTGRFLAARLRVLRHAASRLCAGLLAGRAGVGRRAVGG